MLMVSRWKNLSPFVGKMKFAPQFALAIPEPMSRFGAVRSTMGEGLWRRLFRRVTVVCFAVAIAAAERERRVSSHGDIEKLQTITKPDMRKDSDSRSASSENAGNKIVCRRDGWIGQVEGHGRALRAGRTGRFLVGITGVLRCGREGEGLNGKGPARIGQQDERAPP